jgi:replicative DNA helicase
MMPEQMMPNNPEAEQSVLGSLIIERNAVTSVMEELQETYFYRESHRKFLLPLMHSMPG